MITISTDFGYEDHYVGVMKGVIYGINPRALIVDITHGIKRHDVRHASYILRSIIDYFPESVHVFVVDPGVGTSRRGIVAKLDRGYFVGPDNGILTLVKDRVEKVWEITMRGESMTFHGRDIFAPMAAWVDIGEFKNLREINDFHTYTITEPKREGGNIVGEVIHIDRFGNVITNILPDMIEDAKTVKWKNYEMKIVLSYGFAKKGELIALINSENFLEFAINQGSASEKLNLKPGDKILIEIY